LYIFFPDLTPLTPLSSSAMYNWGEVGSGNIFLETVASQERGELFSVYSHPNNNKTETFPSPGG
tara:strand:+ start:1896 stop:2087 length:192 start_codon:yes stop_codon:yes gene_type:complete